MATNLGNIAFSLDGLALNATHDNGVRISVEDTNWSDGSASTIQPRQRARANGATAGPAQLQARPVVLAGQITAPDIERLTETIDSLKAAASLSSVALVGTEGSLVRTMQVRRDGAPLVKVLNERVAKWSIQLIATDPRKTATNKVGSTFLPESTGGLTVLFTVPFTIDATVVSGQISLTNQGNTGGKLMLRLDGPLTAPTITHTAASTSTTLVFSSSLNIPDGEFLLVDPERRTVLLNGTAARNGYITSRGWFQFEPGVNVLTFSAQSGTGTLTATGTPSWG